MRRQTLTDEFFRDQPPLSFVEELKKPLFLEKYPNFGRTSPQAGEADASGIFLNVEFPDSEGKLETVVSDFIRFSQVFGIAGEKYPVTLCREKIGGFESYQITVTRKGTVISAEDTEGIRRAVIRLEDEMIAREGAFLPLGRTEKHSWLKSRISRGFFSPTNRPPKNIDELYDDADYYPDEYLNRLMHDGTNGLWIYTRFRDLLPSSVVKEYGKEYRRRIDKLNRLTAKCARYGIKVYVFAVEPAAFDAELHDRYPDLMGQKLDKQYCLCPNGPGSATYLFESGKLLAELCPDLGGAICLTAGERLTSCASLPNTNCPRCQGMPRGEILAKAVELLCRGMKTVNPAVEFVSWTYGHREWAEKDIQDYVRAAPPDVCLMQNFDDYGFETQLGKQRIAIDYWLSYIGPSRLFRVTERATKEYGKTLWAKMQICCSHELASLPYFPSPYNVFAKLKRAKAAGVTGIMECWYFGNYPCVMNKAVGELAFADRMGDGKTFLHRLAAITYGGRYAETVRQAFEHCYRGYRNYPLNIMFSYYGPMHDGVVWELSLKPKNYSLPRSWQLMDRPDGDRIEECLMYGHTLGEAIVLAERMRKEFGAAVSLLAPLSDVGNPALDDLISVTRALFVLSRSAENILRFYADREELGLGSGRSGAEILQEMRALTEAEIRNSEEMCALCVRDSRLGYHSEAEGYKFFPKKLKSRIRQLENLLRTEFPETEARLERGLPPLAYYDGEEEESRKYILKRGSVESAPWEYLSNGKDRFRMAETKEEFVIEMEALEQTRFGIMPEFQILHPTPGAYIYSAEKSLVLPVERIQNLSIYGARLKRERRKWNVTFLNDEGTRIRVVLKKKDFAWNGRKPFKISFSTYGVPWIEDSAPCRTLCKEHISPGEFGWIFFEEEKE